MSKPSKATSKKSLRTRYLTVGQTARILGVSPSTLRLWENVGLISPARSSGKYRLYGHELLEVLKRIKYLRDVKKLSVPGIKKVLSKTPPEASGAGAESQPAIGSKLRKMSKDLGLGIVE